MKLGFNKKLFAKKLLDLKNEEERIWGNLKSSAHYWHGDFEELKKNHKKVEKLLSSHIKSHGWPGIPSVGWDAALAAAQLSCHCITNPGLLRFCLPFMEQSYRFGSIPGSWFLQFYDTLMHFEGKPQIFGTYLDWDENGLFRAVNLLDPDNLKQRRAEFNVEKIKEVISLRPPEGLLMRSPEEAKQYRISFQNWAKLHGWRDSESA